MWEKKRGRVDLCYNCSLLGRGEGSHNFPTTGENRRKDFS